MKDVPVNLGATSTPPPRRRAGGSHWLRDAPVGAKLNAIVAVYVVSLLIFGVMAAAALELSEAVRAYVTTEGLWTKGQKNAVIALTRYIHSGEETDYQEYLKAVSIPLEMRRSRLELEKPDDDPVRADQYLAQAGVQSAEARTDMIWLFRCCHGMEPFASAVEIWREGDEWIALLVREAERAHARFSTGLDEERFHAESQREIEAINGRLTVLEREFSFVISHTAEMVHTATLWVVFLSGTFLLLLSLLLSRQVSRYLNAGVVSLNEGIRRASLGDLEYRIPAQSADELGRLAETFNDMISRRRVAEDALEQQREFLSSILENLSEGVAACDENGRLTFFNRSLSAILGEADPSLDPTDWSARYSVYLADGRTPAPTEQLPLVRALRGEIVKDVELVIAAKNTVPRTILCSGQRIVTGSGKRLGAVVAVRDVTESRHAEERFRQIVETAPNAMVMVDRKGRILLVNAQLEKLLGYRRDELLGQPVEVLVPWDKRERHPGLRKGYFDNPEVRAMGRGLELYALTKGRDEIPVEIGLSPIHTPEGILVMASIVDVSERRRAETELKSHAQALERASADLSQFAFSAAHHLQEPLRTVMSYTQLLAKEFTDTRKQETGEYVGYVNEAVLRMRDLIEGLRAYTRVTLRELSFERTDLNRALTQALKRLQDEIAASGARITHDPLPTLMANESLITELFLHLIGNALKFRGSAPPVIHVGEEQGEREWMFSVRDNGIGIESRHAEQVFELFERLHTRDVYPGNGIGLTLCKRIVERHGGRIWVEPGNPGSVFRFTLSARPIAALHKMH